MAFRCSPEKKALRSALDLPEGTIVPRDHPREVEKVKKTHPHTIKFISAPQNGTCVAYAFGLSTNAIYQEVRTNFDKEVFAGKAFIEWLMAGVLVECDKPALDALVLYFSDARWEHIGLMKGASRVASQWGTYAIYEHDICEVPVRYGDMVRFFEEVTATKAIDLFLEYARFEGISEQDIAAIIAHVGRC
jgi:hypothetical protein